MDKTFLLTLQTPSQNLFNNSASKLTIRTELGYLGILPNHSPVIARLKEGNFKIWVESGKNIVGNIKSGILYFEENEAIILSNEITIFDSEDNFNLFEVPEFKKEK